MKIFMVKKRRELFTFPLAWTRFSLIGTWTTNFRFARDSDIYLYFTVADISLFCLQSDRACLTLWTKLLYQSKVCWAAVCSLPSSYSPQCCLTLFCLGLKKGLAHLGRKNLPTKLTALCQVWHHWTVWEIFIFYIFYIRCHHSKLYLCGQVGHGVQTCNLKVLIFH